MEPGTKVRRCASKRLTFLGPRTLLSWLESPCGAEIRQTIEERWLPDLEGMLFTTEEGKRLQAEVLMRHDRTVPVIVDCEPLENGKWYLRIYGPRELKIAIVQRPVTPPVAALEIIAEQIVEASLPKALQPHYYPSNLRKREILEPLTAEEYRERELKREADELFCKALKGSKK